MNTIISTVKTCCPWFFEATTITQYHKRISENEHEQFMKQTFQHANDRNQYHSRKKNVPLTQVPRNKTEGQSVTESKNMQDKKQMISQDILSQLPAQSYKSYNDCISPSHPFYNLLKPKLQLLPRIFDIQADPLVHENDYKLKIMIKSSEDDKTNVFVYTFVFPTTYQFYQAMLNNFQLQKSFDSNIDVYECQQKIDDNTKIIYLAYKKILIVSPRDFVYVRYTFKKYNEFWSIATSVPDSNPADGKTRGTILLTATKAVEKDGMLQLTVYSQIDMKMPVKASAAKVRGTTQIKKYLDKCYEHVVKQKNTSIL